MVINIHYFNALKLLLVFPNFKYFYMRSEVVINVMCKSVFGCFSVLYFESYPVYEYLTIYSAPVQVKCTRPCNVRFNDIDQVQCMSPSAVHLSKCSASVQVMCICPSKVHMSK